MHKRCLTLGIAQTLYCIITYVNMQYRTQAQGKFPTLVIASLTLAFAMQRQRNNTVDSVKETSWLHFIGNQLTKSKANIRTVAILQGIYSLGT